MRGKDLEDTRDLPLHYTPVEGAGRALESDELASGTPVGTYFIREKIASGGGGTVYRAEDAGFSHRRTGFDSPTSYLSSEFVSAG